MASAAAVVARARRLVLGYFFAHNAVTPENAQPFESDRRLQRRQFERLRARGVIREAKPGTYYVDVPVWHAWQKSLHLRILVVLITVLVTMFTAIAVTTLRHG